MQEGREPYDGDLMDFTKKTHPDYRPSKIHYAMADALQQFLQDVEDELSPRLILEVPVRHGKSELASIRFPAYAIGKHPDWPIVHSSYNTEKSNDFSRQVRDLVESSEYQALFPGVLPSRSSRSVKRWNIEGTTGSFVSVGVGSSLTGRGAVIAIIDDPIKDAAEADSELQRQRLYNWFDAVLSTRMERRGGIIIIQSRWHVADLVGYVAEGRGSKDEGKILRPWKRIRFPAIAETDDSLGRKPGEALWPENQATSAKELNRIRATTPPRWWLALFQQRPAEDGGNILHVNNIKDFPNPLPEMRVFQAWDLAISEKRTADYSVCVTIGVDIDNNIYILHIDRKRTGFNATMDRMLIQASERNPISIGIETAGYQASAFQEASRRFILPFKEVKPGSTDKVVRAQLPADRIDLGRVYADKSSGWWKDFEEEALAFPVGEHDDMVDALAYACMLATEPQIYMGKSSFVRVPREVTRDPEPGQYIPVAAKSLPEYMDGQGRVIAVKDKGIFERPKRRLRLN